MSVVTGFPGRDGRERFRLFLRDSFNYTGTPNAPVGNSRATVPPDANRLLITLTQGQALRIRRIRAGVFDGGNTNFLTALQKGKLQLQFSPFGISNSFAEYQGEAFLNTAQPAVQGIDLTPEIGDYLTLVDDWLEFDDYRASVGTFALGIGIQAYWQIANRDAAVHPLSVTFAASWEIWQAEFA